MAATDQAEREVQDWPFWQDQPTVRVAGGLLDPRTLDEWHRTACGYVRHAYRSVLTAHADSEFKDQFDHLSLVFVGSPQKNALALEEEGRRTIVVFIGMVRQLWSTIQTSLGTARFLHGMFDSEPPARKPDAGSRQQLHLGEGWPEDRQAALHDLFQYAVEFLMCHELAHHARGHLPYLRKRRGVKLIDEALNAQANRPGNAVMRNIEFDADFHAIDLLVEYLEKNAGLNTWSVERAATEHFLRLVAVICFFQMFDADHLPMDKQYQSTHPAIVHRAIRATSVLSKAIAGELNWAESRRIDEHDEVWLAAAQLARDIGMPTGRWHGAHTHRMGLARLDREERSFIRFSRRLDRYNRDENG